jgi:hypothetical protein
MDIEPLSSYAAKPYALLVPGNRELYVSTVNGTSRFASKRDVVNALAKLKGHVCYVPNGLSRLKYTTGATDWVLTTWRGRDVKMTHTPTGVTVTSLRGVLDGAPDQFAALDETLGWLREYGIGPASLATMSWNLLRASLGHSLTIGFDHAISRPAFYGGRQGIESPNVYRNMVAFDIRAAYPAAMSSRPVALSLKKVDATTHLDPTESGIAKARVRVPKDLKYPPLPVRVDTYAICFQTGDIEGSWTWCELDAAAKLGCEIEILESYAPRRTFDLFGPWWQLAQTGRELSPAAAKLSKAIANSTWGQFAMTGEGRQEVQWCDDKGDEPFYVDCPSRSMPHQWAVHIAAEVTSRVRVQTLTEGLYGMNGPAIHVDTDGLIGYADNVTPLNVGSNFGQWSVKEKMDVLEIRAPQLYRFRRPERNDWKYVASGMTARQAAYVFSKSQETTSVAYLSYTDTVLPTCDASDVGAVNHYLQQAKKLGAA